jgi:hypothetical protein
MQYNCEYRASLYPIYITCVLKKSAVLLPKTLILIIKIMGIMGKPLHHKLLAKQECASSVSSSKVGPEVWEMTTTTGLPRLQLLVSTSENESETDQQGGSGKDYTGLLMRFDLRSPV